MGLHSVFENTLGHKNSLGQIEAAIWESLKSASMSNRHGWHAGALSTVALRQQSVVAVHSRTVILRSADSLTRTVDCHTDARSAKVADLGTCPTASWMFYDPKSRIQLRLGGEARVIDGEEADEAWNQTPLASRAAYLSVTPPAAKVESDTAPSTDDRNVSQTESERGREHFRLVRLDVHVCDWLYLRREGHLRVQADYSDREHPQVSWLVP